MYNYIGFHIRKLLLSGLYNRKSGKIHSEEVEKIGRREVVVQDDPFWNNKVFPFFSMNSASQS